MSHTFLSARRRRWRSAPAGLAIATASFTVAACGEEPVEDEGVVEEDVVEEEPLEEDD